MLLVGADVILILVSFWVRRQCFRLGSLDNLRRTTLPNKCCVGLWEEWPSHATDQADFRCLRTVAGRPAVDSREIQLLLAAGCRILVRI